MGFDDNFVGSLRFMNRGEYRTVHAILKSSILELFSMPKLDVRCNKIFNNGDYRWPPHQATIPALTLPSRPHQRIWTFIPLLREKRSLSVFILSLVTMTPEMGRVDAGVAVWQNFKCWVWRLHNIPVIRDQWIPIRPERGKSHAVKPR